MLAIYALPFMLGLTAAQFACQTGPVASWPVAPDETAPAAPDALGI